MSAMHPKATDTSLRISCRDGPQHKVAALQPAARGPEPRGRPAERTPIAGGEPRPENRGVVNLTQDGAPHESRDPQLCQSAASAYDRKIWLRASSTRTRSAAIVYSLQAVRRLGFKRSPDTATPDEVRRFQLYLIESGASICNRNRIMTGVQLSCSGVTAASPRSWRPRSGISRSRRSCRRC